MKGELRNLNIDPYKTLSRHLTNKDIRPELMFIFPVIVGDSIGGNKDIDTLLRRLYAKQIASYLELENISQIIVNNIKKIYEINQISGELEGKLFLDKTDNISNELAEFLKTQHITNKLDQLDKKKSSANEEILNIIQRLSQIVEEDPYLQEYVPIVFVLKDKNSGALFPIIIGTKKFQASDRAIALILLIAQLFGLTPISNTANFEKLKYLIKQGILNDIITLIQNGEFSSEKIEELKKQYKIDKDHIPEIDGDIIKELGARLKELLKIKKYSDSEILGALKQFELAFSENIYISLGNITNPQDTIETDEQLIRQIIEHIHGIYEDKIKLLNESILNNLLLPIINGIDTELIKQIQKIQEYVIDKKIKKDLNNRNKLINTIESVNVLFNTQDYIIQIISRLETQIMISRYITSGTIKSLLLHNTADIVAREIADSIFSTLISRAKQHNIPIANLLQYIQQLFTNQTKQIKIQIQGVITKNKENIIKLIVQNLDKNITDIYQIIINGNKNRDLLDQLIKNGYIPRINNNRVKEFIAAYINNKVSNSIDILLNIIKTSIAKQQYHDITIVPHVINQTDNCLTDFNKLYSPVYKNTVFEKYLRSHKYIENICNIYESINTQFTTRITKMLKNSAANRIINDIINTANILSSQLSTEIQKKVFTILSENLRNTIINYHNSTGDNINLQTLQQNLSNVENIIANNISKYIDDMLSTMIQEFLLLPIYTLYLFIFELLLFSLYVYTQQNILMTLILINTRDWKTIANVIKDLDNKNSLLGLKLLFDKYGINYAVIVHEYSIIWMYNILSILEIDKLYLDDTEDEEHKMPAPGEWAKITEDNIKYIVKYVGKIMKVPIITYNDDKQRVVYYLPLMKNPVKTNLDSVKKFIGIEG